MTSLAKPITVILPQPAPVDEFTGPEFANFSTRGKKRTSVPSENSVLCTACGASIAISSKGETSTEEVHEHPILNVLICKVCSTFYHNGPFTQDQEGFDEQCRWCGQGGNLIMCDGCTYCFCNYCIKRNFSQKVFSNIRDRPQWKCFVCDKLQIEHKVRECRKVMRFFEDDECSGAPPSNDSQEQFLDCLAEGNRHLDDLLAPMENLTGHPEATQKGDPVNKRSDVNAEKKTGKSSSKKVNPIRILREKERYTVQQRSAISCDERTNVKEESKRLSDPESKATPRFPKGKGSADEKAGRKVEKQNENNINLANTADTPVKNVAQLPENDFETTKRAEPPSSSATSVRRNVGKRTKAKTAKPQAGDGEEEITGTKIPLEPVNNTDLKEKMPTRVEAKVKEAKNCLVQFIRIYKELVKAECDGGHVSNTVRSHSPTQYARFRTTSLLLTNVKKASSRLIRLEHDLRARKTQLGTYRESCDSDISLTSSEEEFQPAVKEKKSRKGKKHTRYSGYQEAKKSESRSEREADIDQPCTSKFQPRSPRIVLKKLTEDEILKLSQSSRKESNSASATTVDSADTGSSKKMKPDDLTDSDQTTLDSDSCDVVGRSKVKASSVKREKRKPKKKLESDSDYEIETDDYSPDSERSTFDEMNDPGEGLNFSSRNDNDNEIAMNMLFQKIQQQGVDSADSDVEKLVDKDDAKKDEMKNQKWNEEADETSQKEDKSCPERGKLYRHPLLNQKWKDDSIDNVQNKNSESENKRKRSKDRDSAAQTQDGQIMNGHATNSDSDLSTDSECEVPIKKRKARKVETKRKILKSDSDSSDSVLVVQGDDHGEEDHDKKEEASPMLLKRKRRRVVANSDSETELKVKKETADDGEETTQKKGRKNIRKILDDDELDISTQMASKEEMKRRKRLEKEHEGEEEKEEVIFVDENSNTPVKKTLTVGLKLSKNPLVEVHRELVRILKPHQVEGVQFLWDNIIEKVKDAGANRGNGCILAHCMGLGKTLQAIAFLHTVLMSNHLPKLRTALVLCPLGTVNNWVAEFKKWLSKYVQDSNYKLPKLLVMDLNSARTELDRINKLQQWQQRGGVMVMAYGLFRTLFSDTKRQTRSKELFTEQLLSPGADILVCDEGHILKNATTRIATLVQGVKTKRKIVLTGTPLQNNMVEYHCMVSIVKPRLLGNLKEFKNRFINPIENGQHVDSTERDVKLMKKRAHVLHELLSGCVQRKDYSCLRAHLAPKYEYTLKVRLSDLQIRMYKHYLTLHSSADVKLRKACLFNDFNTLLLLVCHPRCLVMAKERKEGKENGDEWRRTDGAEEENAESEGEDSTSDDSVIMISDDEFSSSQVPKPTTLEDIHALSVRKLRFFIEDKSGKKPETRNRKKLVNLAAKYLDENFCKRVEFEESLKNKSVAELKSMIAEHGEKITGCAEKSDLVNLLKSVVLKQTQTDKEWYQKLMPCQEKLAYANENSGKVMLMLDILQGAGKIGDKVVIFSQSLLTLDLIEEVLKTETKNIVNGLKSGVGRYLEWRKNKDYFRLDGSTPGNLRDSYISVFNNPNNTRARLFIISTRAGGMGINLIGANRAVVFDASWNPSHDIQSIFRIYRFGQTKPCYIYRLIAQGTMEEKIYERQVVKRSLAFRVVDEQQISRHFTASDIAELYNFKPAPKAEKPKDVPDYAPPRDAVLASILKSKDCIVSYHEPDSLLDHQVSEELTEAERRAAWEEYDTEHSNDQTVGASCTQYFQSLRPEVLCKLWGHGEEILRIIEKKIALIKQKPFHLLMLEKQMKNRFMSTEEASRKSIQDKLQEHIMLQRLISLKKKIIMYRSEAKRCYNLKAALSYSNAGPTAGASISSFLRRANPLRSPLGQTNPNLPRNIAPSPSFTQRPPSNPQRRPPVPPRMTSRPNAPPPINPRFATPPPRHTSTGFGPNMTAHPSFTAPRFRPHSTFHFQANVNTRNPPPGPRMPRYTVPVSRH